MTINAWKKPAAIFAALSLLAGAAHADDAAKAEYLNACAACHGETGVGDGPLADLMTVPMPNLTTLTQQNDGIFPMLDVIHIIDGRTGVRGHGYPMPVWGARFKGEVVEKMGDYGAEMVVRGRVLSIAYYLESIQQ